MIFLFFFLIFSESPTRENKRKKNLYLCASIKGVRLTQSGINLFLTQIFGKILKHFLDNQTIIGGQLGLPNEISSRSPAKRPIQLGQFANFWWIQVRQYQSHTVLRQISKPGSRRTPFIFTSKKGDTSTHEDVENPKISRAQNQAFEQLEDEDEEEGRGGRWVAFDLCGKRVQSLFVSWENMREKVGEVLILMGYEGGVY